MPVAHQRADDPRRDDATVVDPRPGHCRAQVFDLIIDPLVGLALDATCDLLFGVRGKISHEHRVRGTCGGAAFAAPAGLIAAGAVVASAGESGLEAVQYCAQCGHQMAASYTFCARCGHRMMA